MQMEGKEKFTSDIFFLAPYVEHIQHVEPRDFTHERTLIIPCQTSRGVRNTHELTVSCAHFCAKTAHAN